MNRKFDMMENTLLNATKATLLRFNNTLSKENYCKQLNGALYEIVVENNYRHFTSNYGARRSVKNFAPSDYVDFIVDRVSKYIGSDVSNALYLNREHTELSLDTLVKCIRIYVAEIVPSLISSDYLIDDLSIMEDDHIEENIKNVRYYQPSNECREAVLEGNQCKVKYSDAAIAGMQAFSSVGKVRENNEDSYYIGVHPKNSDFKIMLVADGMGGCKGGEIASNIAVKEMLQWFESIPLDEYSSISSQKLANMISRKIIEIDKKIKNVCYGAGTTLCFSIIKKDSILMGSVGDSRGFVVENGKLIYTTKSDNRTAQLKIPEPFDRFHPENNRILNALGFFEKDIDYGNVSDIHEISLSTGKDYQVVLCSDGITDCLNSDQIVNISNKAPKNNVAKYLVDAALASVSSFSEELERYKIKAGIMGRFDYLQLKNKLKSVGMGDDYNKVIKGGKDNTTAVSSGMIRRSR